MQFLIDEGVEDLPAAIIVAKSYLVKIVDSHVNPSLRMYLTGPGIAVQAGNKSLSPPPLVITSSL